MFVLAPYNITKCPQHWTSQPCDTEVRAVRLIISQHPPSTSQHLLEREINSLIFDLSEVVETYLVTYYVLF